MLSQGRARVIALALVAVAAVAVVFVCSVRTADNGAATAISRQERKIDVPLRSAKKVRSAPRPSRPKPVLSVSAEEDDDDNGRTPAERALAARIEKALDDENFELAVSCVDEAQKCGVAEIRQAMVDTLGWFGEKALPELTPFLADADDDVRESAKNEWMAALSGIEDESAKIGIVELAMGALNDEDTLEDISGEYIGVDEKLAVESLARIIAGGKSDAGVAKAKETYEFVTGEEWESEEAAARWIAEEYEPSEGR